MSNMEDRLRDAFRADAQTVPPHIVRPFESPTAWRPDRERPTRERRVLVPLAAAAALALIVGGAVVAPKIWPRSDHNNAAATGLASGFPGGKVPATKRPAYLVAVVPRDGSVIVIRSTEHIQIASSQSGTSLSGTPHAFQMAVHSACFCDVRSRARSYGVCAPASTAKSSKIPARHIDGYLVASLRPAFNAS